MAYYFNDFLLPDIPASGSGSPGPFDKKTIRTKRGNHCRLNQKGKTLM
jgi:hypothetical protein